MGHPEPSVLFAQSFIHPHLDEYVDEVLFTEPIVITACEFVEHNASCSSPMVSLLGATSPPSFAMEVFVQCEGEPRFRRLCQPFLYSHSSSNILEVEAVITNHIVIRGSYRSLTLVVYGNTAEDLGQFSIDYDLDNSLASAVCSPVDGNLEDLPPALQTSKPVFEESICCLQSLLFKQQESDIFLEAKRLFSLTLKLFKLDLRVESLRKVVTILVSAALSIISLDLSGTIIPQSHDKHHKAFDLRKKDIVNEARNELLSLCKMLPVETGVCAETEQIVDLDDLGVLATDNGIFDSVDQILSENKIMDCSGFSKLSEDEFTTTRLSLVLILCSSKEGCIQFINGSGMNYLSSFFLDDMPRSTGIILMLLGAIECLTRHAIGCEVFLGWWPREDDNVPSGTSEGYCYILKLLLQGRRHDIASLSMYLLHRLRLYEVAAKFESAVLVSIESSSSIDEDIVESVDALSCINSGAKKLMNLLATSGSIDDPSPAARASKSLILGQEDGILSYRETVKLVESSKYCSANKEIDKHLLSLLKERGFLPLSAALLSSPILRSGHGRVADIFSEIAGSIESILLSLLSCRSGLTFLLLQPEATAMTVLSLQGDEDIDKIEPMPLKFATALISKGFLCRPEDIGAIAEVHIRVVIAIDRLLSATPNTEEFLWSLWELCALSRSDVGRQAMLALGHFPEAISILMEALRCVKGAGAFSSGSSPLSLVIFHSAAELFEIMVMDTTASSLSSWIGHAVELHRALHSSSPGTSRKDAPTRLLEWIDAGVVYHKKGVVGLLRYAAVLASGGDAHLTSSSVLVSDTMDVENVVGDSANGSEIQVIEALLGKLVSDKYYDGVAFRDSSISQLTTAFRILAFIAENSAVAVSLYEEGAMMVLYVVLINCRFMLEQSSSTYDYLVDEGVECNSTADLLMERSREQSVINLLIPSLILLISLLQKLQEARELHRNTKLLNILLRLHQEVSLKLAACADDFSSIYSVSSLGLGAVCNLLVSAVACWPVYGWTPSLFQSLLENGPSNISLAVGPKEACSLLYLLGDLFPEEGIWLWKNGRPSLSAIRTLAVGTLVGLHRERDIDWYTQPLHFEKLLKQFSQLLDKIGQVTLHFAFSALLIIKDMLRVLIVRVACQNLEYAALIIRPVLSWLDVHLSGSFSLSDMDVFKGQRLLSFLASLLEHPCGKRLLLKEGIIGLLGKAIGQTADAFSSDNKLIAEDIVSGKDSDRLYTWCLPVSKSFELICAHWMPIPSASEMLEKCLDDFSTVNECGSIWRYLLKFCQVLPVGKELEACLASFKSLASCDQGRAALLSIFEQLSVPNDKEMGGGNMRDSDFSLVDKHNWIESPPLLICWRKLLHCIESESECQIEVVHSVNLLSVGCLCLPTGSGSLQQGVSLIKYLFGVSHDLETINSSDEEKLKEIDAMLTLLDSKTIKSGIMSPSTMRIYLDQVKSNIKVMLLMLENSADIAQVVDLSRKGSLSANVQHPFQSTEEFNTSYPLGGLEDKFMWECPDTSLDRSAHPLPQKRKMTSLDGSNRRQRGDNVSESIASSSFRLGGGTSSASLGMSRRDTFRQRKPNTSRPPSMHVDDYVARERSMDGLSGPSSNVSSTQRAGSTSGRPPSIHVDEFMARQKERQNLVPPTIGEVAQVRAPLHDNVQDPEQLNKPQKLKADLDDDHEINIVFDDELESDDVLSFPQTDGNLMNSVIVKGKNSPGSLNNEGSQFAHVENLKGSRTNGSENTGNSLRRSVPQPETSKMQDATITTDNNQDKKLASPFVVSSGYTSNMSANLVGPPMMYFEKGVPSGHTLGEPRLTSAGNARDNQHKSSIPVAVSQGLYEQRPSIHQPPLPPVPPPPTVSSVVAPQVEPHVSHAPSFHPSIHDMHPPFATGFPFSTFEASGSSSTPTHSREDRSSRSSGTSILLVPSSSTMAQESQNKPFKPPIQHEHESAAGNSPMPSATLTYSFIDPKNMWPSVPSSSRLHDDGVSSIGPGRPLPPLPPTPHPLSTSIAQATAKPASQPLMYSQSSTGVLPSAAAPLTDARGAIQTLPSPSVAQFIPPLPPGRPTSIQGNQFSGIPLQQVQNQSSHSFAVQIPQSIQAVAPRPPLQPPQPLQPPRPIHSQLPRPMIPMSQQPSEGIALQQSPSTLQIPIQPLPMQQPLQIPQVHIYSQAPCQELRLQAQQQVEHMQVQHVAAQGDGLPQIQQETGMSLQQYFASPEAIQSLLRDQDKLCQLLEKHPKLMQMLQERLSQL